MQLFWCLIKGFLKLTFEIIFLDQLPVLANKKLKSMELSEIEFQINDKKFFSISMSYNIWDIY